MIIDDLNAGQPQSTKKHYLERFTITSILLVRNDKWHPTTINCALIPGNARARCQAPSCYAFVSMLPTSTIDIIGQAWDSLPGAQKKEHPLIELLLAGTRSEMPKNTVLIDALYKKMKYADPDPEFNQNTGVRNPISGRYGSIAHACLFLFLKDLQDIGFYNWLFTEAQWHAQGGYMKNPNTGADFMANELVVMNDEDRTKMTWIGSGAALSLNIDV